MGQDCAWTGWQEQAHSDFNHRVFVLSSKMHNWHKMIKIKVITTLIGKIPANSTLDHKFMLKINSLITSIDHQVLIIIMRERAS